MGSASKSEAFNIYHMIIVGAILVIGFMCLLLASELENSREVVKTSSVKIPVAGRARQVLDVTSPESAGLHYMINKRRVPNGPDPIHNRRAGNSKRPPGQA